MGKPSARITDSCAHGGKVVTGEPTVIIGGMPASRIGDNHVCPMVCPGPVPHVGGPIIPPCAVNVIIGSRPAARIGDKAICACAIDSIVTGEVTVLIGTSSAGMPVVPSRIPQHQSVKKSTFKSSSSKKGPMGGAPAGDAPAVSKLQKAGVKQGTPATPGATSLGLAQDLASQIREGLPRKDRPMMSAVAVDRRTGKVYSGVSGKPLPTPHPQLAARVEARKKVKPPNWDPENCAEFQAVNAALHGGAQLSDLEVATVVTKNGKARERCNHCKVTTRGATATTDNMVGGAGVTAAAAQPGEDEGPKPGHLGAFHGQEMTLSCGIASCRMVIENINGEDWPEETLRDEAVKVCGYDDMRGTAFYQLPNLLTAHGVKSSGPRNMSFDDLARSADPTHPAIVDVGKHAIVVDKVVPGPGGQRLVRVRDPQFGPGLMEEQAFRERYQGQAITTSKW